MILLPEDKPKNCNYCPLYSPDDNFGLVCVYDETIPLNVHEQVPKDCGMDACPIIQGYPVYEVTPGNSCYNGYSLVAASSVDEASEIIRAFKESDSSNKLNSFGYGNVYDYDIIDGLYSTVKGIIHYGINYHG